MMMMMIIIIIIIIIMINDGLPINDMKYNYEYNSRRDLLRKTKQFLQSSTKSSSYEGQ
jgi:hypothetical protein